MQTALAPTDLSAPRIVARPKGLPLFGQLLDFRRDRIAFITRMFREHGDIVPLRFGPQRAVLVADPDLIKRVLVENARNYPRSGFYAIMQLAMGTSMLTTDGDLWRRRRRIAQPAFHREKLAAIAQVMASMTNDFVDRFRGLGLGRVVDVNLEMTQLTLKIVAMTLFSSDVAKDDGVAVGDALTYGSHFITERAASLYPSPHEFPTPAKRKLDRARATVEGVLRRTIVERRKSGADVNDVLSLLLGARDEDTGEALTDEELIAESFGLFGAGHETSATALAWTLVFLSRHPEVRSILRDEARGVLGGGPVSPRHIPELRYTRQVIEESMRLRPPAWLFSRSAAEEDTFGTFPIPKDAFVLVAPYLVHRHPDLWPNPEGFDPTRFAPGRAEERHAMSYIPFGAGGHKCIGAHFAMMEMTMILAAMAQAFDLDLLPGVEPEMDAAVTLRPKSAVPMRIGRVH